MNNDNKLVIEYNDFRVIEETDKYILGHLWEQAYLYDKDSKNEILLCEFYGECNCGIIDKNNKWCVVAGDILAIWKNGKIVIIDKEELKWIHDIRIKNSKIIEFLIDPWATNSAIWQLNIDNMELIKISDFDSYKNKPYSDNVEW